MRLGELGDHLQNLNSCQRFQGGDLRSPEKLNTAKHNKVSCDGKTEDY